MSTPPTAPPAANTRSGSNLALALAEAQAADVVALPLEATTTTAAPVDIADTHPEATTTTGPPGENMVAAATRVGNRSTCSTRACERPGAIPGTWMMSGIRVACSKLVCFAHSALSPSA